MIKDFKEYALNLFKKNNIILTEFEKENIEITDFGLNNLKMEGLGLVIYENNEYYCAKELILMPNQICPEHRHPNINNKKGKTETFRCRYGTVHLYVDDSTLEIKNIDTYNQFYTVKNEIILMPGEQYTINANTLHWFKAGSTGAIVSEFSTTSDDASDIFTNPNIQR